MKKSCPGRYVSSINNSYLKKNVLNIFEYKESYKEQIKVHLYGRRKKGFYKKGLRQCAKLQDLGDSCDCDCCDYDYYGGKNQVKLYFIGFAQKSYFIGFA